MQEASFTAKLKKGENTIIFEAHNKPFIDYIEITPPQNCVINNGKVSDDNRKIGSLETHNTVTLQSAELLENNTVIGGLYKNDKLINVFFFDTDVTTSLAYEEVSLGSVEISEEDKTEYEIRIFVWEDITNIKPVIK